MAGRPLPFRIPAIGHERPREADLPLTQVARDIHRTWLGPPRQSREEQLDDLVTAI